VWRGVALLVSRGLVLLLVRRGVVLLLAVGLVVG